jgi:outer membrane protein
MKKIVLFATAALLLLAGTAIADSIAGKVGITARGGASYIFNSEWSDEIAPYATELDKDIKPDIGWTGGGGIMYGINDNLAVTFDVIYLQTDLQASSVYGEEYEIGTGKTVDFALGAQWRFMPKSAFVPYIGAGVDVMWNDLSLNDELETMIGESGLSLEVDPTYGAHLSVGADFFITPNIALNAEIRGLYSSKGDVNLKYGSTEVAIAEYNPSNISGFVGIRFFF